MERLIEAMSHPGFSWPTCPEGGAGKPGYERYADCPEGWAPTSKSELGHGGLALSYCVKRGDSCGSNQRFTSHSNNGTCSEAEYMARPVRSDPYYFDITDVTEEPVLEALVQSYEIGDRFRRNHRYCPWLPLSDMRWPTLNRAIEADNSTNSVLLIGTRVAIATATR